MLVGICGKTNVGKSTFFAAATLAPVEISNRPFTTINPNEGVAYVRVKSLCSSLGVRCSPRFGSCDGTYRFVPVSLLDVAGLVPGAHAGRGLGNKFLDDLRKANGNILVVDCSGATDPEGNPAKPGTYNPIEDVLMVEREFAHWVKGILDRNWRKIRSEALKSSSSVLKALLSVLSGLSISAQHIVSATAAAGLSLGDIMNWSNEKKLEFSFHLFKIAKPMVIAANKVDVQEAEKFLLELKRSLSDYVVVPVSSEAELILKKAAKAGLISYRPGDSDFKVTNPDKLSRQQLKVLDLIRDKILRKYGSTGVQNCLEELIFNVMKYIAVFPVEDENKLSDHKGNILPDVFIVPQMTTPKELAYMIHTELGRSFIYAVDAIKKMRIPSDKPLTHRSVIKIFSSLRRG